MTCVCVRCGAVQSHLYMRYPHGSVLSTPCETCSSPDGSNTAREENANATRGRGDVVINQKQAADPYVENDGLVVFLDLILVKPRAFRHLLFNRPVLDYERQSNDAAGERNAKRVKKKADGIEFLPSVAVPDSAAWLRAVRSFVAVQLVDSFLRWYYLCAHTPATLLGGTASPSAAHPILEPWAKDFSSRDILHSYLLVFIAVTSEAFVFLMTVTSILSSYTFLKKRIGGALAVSQATGSKRIPLKSYLIVNALLLANVSSLFLLSLVLLWQAGQDPSDRSVERRPHRQPDVTILETKMGLDALANRLLDWKPDHVVRHLVAGLSSGVSLAVVLPRAPIMTTASILTGWAASAMIRSFTLLPSSSGDGAALTAEGRFASPFFCPTNHMR